MSYSIYIGERMQGEQEPGEDFIYADFAQGISLPEAPKFVNDEMTGNGNSRHPSYSGWSNFVDACGLTDLFYNKTNGLMREHSGCADIDVTHLKIVKGALDAWPRTKEPGFSGWNGEDQDKYDAVLARLIWLEWWMRWAIENCKRPCLSNT
jgi:hypothetical protein